MGELRVPGMTGRDTAPGAQTSPATGPQGAAAPGRTSVAALLIMAVAAAVAWIRMPPIVAVSLYAEDGRTFVGGWFTGHGWLMLWGPYAGYQHLIPRLASGLVVSLLPVPWWAPAVHVVACGVVGVIAGLVFVYSRDVIAFCPSRVVLGLITVLTPIAGQEALGNLANLHWFVLYLTPWLLLATPRSTAGTWAMTLVALLATATEPQCAVFLPLVLWRIVRCRRTWPVMAGWMVGVTAQVITFMVAPRAVATVYPPLASTVEGYVLNAGMTVATSRPRVLGAVLVHIGWWIGFAGVAAILAVAVVGFVWGQLMARVAIAALVYGSVLSWTASFVLGSNPLFFYSTQTDDQLTDPLLVRWATAASMLLVATIPVAVGVLVQRYPRSRPVGAGTLLAFVCIMALSLPSGGPPDNRGWGPEVEKAETKCAATGGVVKLVTPPWPPWGVRVPCSRLTG